MHIAIWIVQALLALVFLMAGTMKLLRPKEELQKQMAYVEDLSQPAVRSIGLLEVLAAFGLILPQLTGVLPWLTPVAAAGLVATMIGAAILHARRDGEERLIGGNAVLLLLALFVTVGRSWLVPV